MKNNNNQLILKLPIQSPPNELTSQLSDCIEQQQNTIKVLEVMIARLQQELNEVRQDTREEVTSKILRDLRLWLNDKDKDGCHEPVYRSPELFEQECTVGRKKTRYVVDKNGIHVSPNRIIPVNTYWWHKWLRDNDDVLLYADESFQFILNPYQDKGKVTKAYNARKGKILKYLGTSNTVTIQRLIGVRDYFMRLIAN